MLSVVIPLYDKAETIERALDSVLAQTIQDYEVVVVDDGSRDHGAEIVSAYGDPRIRLVRQANAGVSAARNRGVAESAHELVCFLDADDWWEPDHLEEIARLRLRYPGAAMYATAFAIRDDQGLTRPAQAPGHGREEIGPAEYFAIAARSGSPVHSSAVAVTRTMLRQVGGFPEGVTIGEDLLTWARLACAGSLAYSHRVSATFQQPPIAAADRRSHVRPPPKDDVVGAALRCLARRHGASCPDLPCYLGLWFRMRGLQYLERGDHVSALREIGFAVRADRIRGKDLATAALACVPQALGVRALEISRRRRYRRSAIEPQVAATEVTEDPGGPTTRSSP